MAGQSSSFGASQYFLAWRDVADNFINTYPNERNNVLQMNQTLEATAQALPYSKDGIKLFRQEMHKQMKHVFGDRAQPFFKIFDERIREIHASLSSGQAGQQPLTHTHHQSGQQPQLNQQQQQQQQQHAQMQMYQQQQQQQQQMLLAQQQQQAQQQQAQAVIQPLYHPPPAATAGMYAQQPGMMMNPLATAAPGMGQQQQPNYPAVQGGTNLMTVAQQQQQLAQQQQLQRQRQLQSASTTPATNVPLASAAAGKPPKAPKSGKRPADGEAGGAAAPGGGDVEKPAVKRAKPAAAPRRKKGQDSDADEDAADKMKVGDELLVDLQAETDAAMEGLDTRRRIQLPTVPGGQSWDDGYQYLSAWRLTNEVLLQRKEKMPGAAASTGPAGVVDFLEPSMLRALQLGFTAHAAEVMRRAAHAAKHRATSAAAQRRPEFVASGEDARRGLGDIRRAAEKIAADKAAIEREELMKKAQSKRADEETRERAQKARAEMAGQQQASAANKAIAATLGGGKGAKWSKWSGSGAPAGAAAGKGKGKGAKGDAAAGNGGGDGADGSSKVLASSKSRGDLGTASSAAGTSATDALESTDIQLQDLIVALQQDPTYCKSMLLYKLLNGISN